MEKCVAIALRSSQGVSLIYGPPSYENVDAFPQVHSKNCTAILFSPLGRYFAYTEGEQLHILRTDTWIETALIKDHKAYHMSFSPKDTYIMTWQIFTTTKDNPEGFHNLRIFRSEDGEMVHSFVHKTQSNWEPQFTQDEVLFSKSVGTDVFFYETPNFETTIQRLSGQKVSTYSLSPTTEPYHLLCHIPGVKGQPSFARLFRYPNFQNQQIVATKSFFQADRVEYYWSNKGTHVLLLTITDVDKTGTSYYGKQALHLLGTNRETAMVTLSTTYKKTVCTVFFKSNVVLSFPYLLGKDGPIYSVAWSPRDLQFCVVYGSVPARATIFNIKCETVLELGAGPRNTAYYNPQGNLLLLGGFGNFRGQLEIWNLNTKKIVSSCDAPDSTLFQWGPDGMHFLTATTAPRLKVANEYKIWHYSGVLLHEKLFSNPEHLYEAYWQNFPKNSFRVPIITNDKVQGIQSSVAQASKEAYRPPSARNKPSVKFSLHDVEESSSQHAAASKAALKQRKKRENRKAKKLESDASPTGPANCNNKPKSVEVLLTGDAEKDKKIKNIKKKLNAIVELKEQLKQGKTLEINQQAKVNGEADLLKELQQLQL